MGEFNIAPNTQIGKIIIDEKVYNDENAYHIEEEKYSVENNAPRRTARAFEGNGSIQYEIEGRSTNCRYSIGDANYDVQKMITK